MTALLDATLFFLTTVVLFFLPGLFVLRMFLRNKSYVSALTSLTLSFALGLTFLNFILILMGHLGIPFSRTSLILGIAGSVFLLTALSMLSRRWLSHPAQGDVDSRRSFDFSRKQTWLFVTLLVLTFLIKTVYLSHAVLPTSTDLGHHMYWSKLIAETKALPTYAKQEIVTTPDGTYEITAPEPIADFIIGEHLPFSAIHILSGLDFLSAFPVLFLFLINLLALLALVAVARFFGENLKGPNILSRFFTPQNIALGTLFFFGPLYTLASPQAKFVSGGVVGNTLGNLFIPLIILAYGRAFTEKRSDFLALGFFLTFSLAYIHHLSMLILLFILFASVVLFVFIHRDTLKKTLLSWWYLFARPKPLLVAVLACLFFFVVAMPTYIDTSAVGTAIGTPTKNTRTGLTWFQVTFSSGEARVALGVATLLFLALLRTRTTYAGALLFGWGGILFIMTLFPHFLFIDIPSNRIGSYLSFPLGILASVTFIALLALCQGQQKQFFLPSSLIILLSFSVFFFSVGSGSYDNSQTLLPKSKALSLLQTFEASRYLKEHTGDEDVILKDHNYIVGDAWMKLFFLRDYSYPLSRGFFKRYEDNPNREQCTLLMISVPNTARGEKCYTETGTNFVVVNPHFDITPFEKSSSFARIYASDDIHIYARTR